MFFSRAKRADVFAVSVLLAFAVFAAPLLAQTMQERMKNEQTACMTNLKQLSVALMMYVQDYDEHYPTAYNRDKTSVWTWSEGSGSGWDKEGSVYPYIKDRSAFHCPSVRSPKTATTYMYNDLVSGVSLATVPSPASIIALCDGEDVSPNIGHAYAPGTTPAPAVLGKGAKSYRLAPGMGARLSNAPTRHAGGANYGYGDGHVKWSKPTGIVFPPRNKATLTPPSPLKPHQGTFYPN